MSSGTDSTTVQPPQRGSSDPVKMGTEAKTILDVENTGEGGSTVRTPVNKRKDFLQLGGIEIEKRRSSSCTSYRISNNKVVIETASGERQELEIVSSKERHGVLRRALPVLSVPVAALCCILNIVPGLGTLVSACLLGCGCGRSDEMEDRTKGACYNLIVALLQVILAPFIVGWIWSIQRGALMLQEAVRDQVQEEEDRSKEGDHNP
ncbi:SPEC3/Stum [Trinorchestia longiramus]|nr:SPEC3/Stum [Trinorchestia longiramus]